jgi:hypothetical protein
MSWAKLVGPMMISILMAGCATQASTSQTPPTAPAPAAPATAAAPAKSQASGTPAADAPPGAPTGSEQASQTGIRAVNRDTHIDLIRADGSVRSLYPPQSLHLSDGPIWSPDGKWVAVYAGSDLTWMAEAATNRWVYLGQAVPGSELTRWDDRWTSWWTEISARPAPKPSGESVTQIRQRTTFKIYLPSRLPQGLTLAYIDHASDSDWAWIGFVDSSGNEALKITERQMSGMGASFIPRQYSDLPKALDESGQTAASVACRSQGECTVAWTGAQDTYLQVETAFPFALTQADLLKLVASLSPTATEDQITKDLAPLGHIAP